MSICCVFHTNDIRIYVRCFLRLRGFAVSETGLIAANVSEKGLIKFVYHF